MMVQVRELIDSGRSVTSDSPTFEIKASITGTSDALEARVAFINWALPVFAGMPAREYLVEPVGFSQWTGTVNYAPLQRGDTDDVAGWNFEIGAGSQRITQSKETVGQYTPVGDSPADFKGAVGVTRDGVEGVDVDNTTFRWTETHKFPIAGFTRNFVKFLYQSRGKVNVAAWRIFERGEAKFEGVRGRAAGEFVELDFSFAAEANVTGRSVGEITGINKEGWQYLWVLYDDDVDEAAVPKRMVKRPRAAYVERLFDYMDFLSFGIG